MRNLFDISGKVAIVTGGSKGIGLQMALDLAEAGAEVVIASRHLNEAQTAADQVKEKGRRGLAIQADISRVPECARLIRKTVETFGKVDILVNNAGMNERGPLIEVVEEQYDKIMATDLKGLFFCSQFAAKEMMKQKRDGNIINIGGASGHRCYGGGGAYGPSKAAVISLTKQMAVEWARYNIRVNGVSPGPTLTPRSIKRMRDDEDNKRRIEKILPLGRAGRPEEVAEAVLFLASESSSYITGQMIIVDGGGVETWYLYP